MASGWAQQVVGEFGLPGVVAQVVDSHYAVGGRTSQRDPRLVVRWQTASHGNVRAWAEGGQPAEVGKLMLLPANSQQNAAAIDGAAYTRSLALWVEPDWLEELIGPGAGNLGQRCASIYELRNLNIEMAMRRIFSEVLTPGPMTPLVIKSCSTLIAVELASQGGMDAERDSGDSRLEVRRRQIEDFIQNYRNGWPSQRQIAESLGIGVGHMRQVYRCTTGRNLFSFMKEVRMTRARALLADGHIPLKVVAHLLGYSTPSAFSSAFRREIGVTPRDYRTMALAQALPVGPILH